VGLCLFTQSKRIRQQASTKNEENPGRLCVPVVEYKVGFLTFEFQVDLPKPKKRLPFSTKSRDESAHRLCFFIRLPGFLTKPLVVIFPA
jgi:hypothetical protein